MALNAAVLAAQIAAEVRARTPGAELDDAGLKRFAAAVAAAVVTHLVTAGVVVVPGQPPGRLT